MRRFLSRTALFIIVAAATALLPVAATTAVLMYKSNFRFTESKRIVITGNSHPECAFNDSLIADARNVGHSGEAYLYTYTKIKKLLASNPEIQTVMVEFSNSLIQNKTEQWTWSNYYIASNYLTYFPFLAAEDHYLVARHNAEGWLNGITLYPGKLSERIFRNDYDFQPELGGYMFLTRHRTEQELAKPADPKTDLSVSEIQLYYLEEIIALARAQNKQIILLRSPIHPKSPDLRNETVFMNLVKSRFSETEFLDLKEFPLTNEEYGDLEHVNYLGARKVSVWFNSMLAAGLLREQNKAKFVRARMPVSSLPSL